MEQKYSTVNLDQIIEEINETSKNVQIQQPSPSMQDAIYNNIMLRMKARNVRVDNRTHNNHKQKSFIENIKKMAEIESSLSERIDKSRMNFSYDLSISDGIIRAIDELLNQQREQLRPHTQYEVEASFGSFEPGQTNFYPGIKSNTEFTNLKQFLESQPNFIKQEKEDIVEIMKVDKGNIRKLTNVNTEEQTFETKFRDNTNNVKLEQYGVRITIASESVAFEPTQAWNPNVRRHRKRNSFITSDIDSPYYGFVIDVTTVNETILINKEGKASDKSFQKFEVEIECVIPEKSGKDFVNIIEFVYHGIIGYMAPYKYKDSVAFSTSERRYIVALHNELFKKEMIEKNWKPNSAYKMFDLTYWNKPRNIKIADLQPKHTIITNIKCMMKIKSDKYRFPDELKQTIISRNKGVTFNKEIISFVVNTKDKAYKIIDRISNIITEYDENIDTDYIEHMIETDENREFESFNYEFSFPTLKLNGDRMFLLILKDTCWLLSPPYTIVKFGNILDEAFDGTLLDGELLYFNDKLSFKVFDVLFFKSKDVRRVPFIKKNNSIVTVNNLKHVLNQCRYDTIVEINDNQLIDPIWGEFGTKIFYIEGDIYQRMRNAVEDYMTLSTNDKTKDIIDGIIIQGGGFYINKDTFKWKPQDQLTIDFKFIPINEDDIHPDGPITINNYYKSCYLGVKRDEKSNKKDCNIKEGYVVFSTQPKSSSAYQGQVKCDGIITFNTHENYTKWSGFIVECKWDGRNNFKPIRIRDDRTQPNNYSTAIDVWYDILNPIDLSTICGKNLITMRKFHNRVKEEMLSAYLRPGDTIIDIGSGRGGDLDKWRELGLKKVYAIEPNPINSAELKRRYTIDKNNKRLIKKMPDVELLEFGAENTDKINKIITNGNDGNVNSTKAIVSFFSMTYFGESQEKYDDLLKTIDLIPSEGFFIGAVMDGRRTEDLLKNVRIYKSKNIDKEIETLTNGVDNLINDEDNTTQIDEINDKLTILKTKHDEISTSIEKLVKKSFTKKIDVLRRQNAKLKIELLGLEEAKEKNKKNVDGDKKIKTIKKKLSELNSEIVSFSEKQEPIDAKIKTHRDKLETIQLKIDSKNRQLSFKINDQNRALKKGINKAYNSQDNLRELQLEKERRLPHDQILSIITQLQLSNKKDQKRLSTDKTLSIAIKNSIGTGIETRTSTIVRLKEILKFPEFEPITDEEAVTFANSAFEISQVSEFELYEKGNDLNEIQITLNDPTSMVKDQQEWLFNFSIFERDMNSMGFELLRTEFLDGKNAKFLSKEAMDFSALNRTFCFYRKPVITKQLFQPPRNIDDIVYYPTELDENMIVKGVSSVSGGFIHAVLTAMGHKQYATKTNKEKNNTVLNYRKLLAKKLSFEKFSELHGGELMKRMAYQYTKDGEDEDSANNIAYDLFLERLRDPNVDISDNSLLEILSAELKLSIFIVHVANNKLTPYFYTPHEVYCEQIVKYDRSVVIIKGDPLNYDSDSRAQTGTAGEFYVIGRRIDEEDQFMFKSDDLFIKKVKTMSCSDSL